MNEYQFSILVPVYNVELYIEKCILSVLEQTYGNFELLLVDDGSTDESGKICDKFAESDVRIKVFHKPNNGLIHTRRYAIERASGEYYIFLDSDDYLKKNTLETIYATINRYNCDCVVYDFEKVNNGLVVNDPRPEEKEVILNDKKMIFKKAIFDSSFNAMWRKAVKASCFDGRSYQEYYSIKLAEDLLQSLEIYENANSVVIIPDKLYCYNFNPMSMTKDVRYENYVVNYQVRELVIKTINDLKLFDDSEIEEYRIYCIENLIKEIKRIVQFKTNRVNIISLLTRIKNSTYYSKFLLKYNSLAPIKTSDKVVFLLFKYGLYRPLIMIGKIK